MSLGRGRKFLRPQPLPQHRHMRATRGVSCIQGDLDVVLALYSNGAAGILRFDATLDRRAPASATALGIKHSLQCHVLPKLRHLIHSQCLTAIIALR